MSSNVRPESMARITTPELAKAFIDEQVAAVRAQVGDKKVLLALSGGVDSSALYPPKKFFGTAPPTTFSANTKSSSSPGSNSIQTSPY